MTAKTNDPVCGWDGTVGGEMAQSGVYIWRAVVHAPEDTMAISGDVMLVR